MLFASFGCRVLTGRTGFPGGGKTTGPLPRQGGMTTFQIHSPCSCGRDGPPADVTEWRRCRLLEAGFPPALATALAGASRVDVHALLQLVDRGCPPELAARILAPLDGTG